MYNNQAVLLGRQRITSEALQSIHIAMQLAPHSPEPRVNLGLRLAAAGRYAEAVAQMTVAAQMAPTNPVVQYNLGLASHHAGDPQRAEQIFKQ